MTKAGFYSIFMLFGLALCGLLCPQAAQAQEGYRCPVYGNVVNIDVRVHADDIRIDNTRSVYDLRRESIDGPIQVHQNRNYQVSGLTKGNITVERNITFKTSTESNSNLACIWAEAIMVDVHLVDTVYIANSYAPGSCEFRETYNHEIKHVNVDRTVLNKYIPYLKSRLAMAASLLGVKGPMPASQVSAVKNRMSDRIRQEIDNVVDQMQQERATQQNYVDTASEYERVSRSCRGF